MTDEKPRLDSIWMSGRGSQPRQGKQPALSRDQVVAAAIRVLDAEGLSALSMRKLAGDLGIAPMSLYWHVPTKDSVLELAFDTMLGELELAPAPGAEWGKQVEAICYDVRRLFRQHHWMSQVAGMFPLVGPGALAMWEALIRLTEEGGFRAPTAYRASGTLVSFVLGFVADEVKWLVQMKESGLVPEDIKDAWLQATLALLGEDFPRMRANIEAGDDRDWDDQFEFGLTCMIDGMRARVR